MADPHDPALMAMRLASLMEHVTAERALACKRNMDAFAHPR